MRVQVLGAEVAAKLAAGEVVERPASVVRELVDNALDAGARAVSVYVTHGGLDSIRVVDDGRGINPDDLLLCVERHSTSKLRSIEDLSQITSLGFRGEALHSIAAVGRLRVASRVGEHAGREVEWEGLRLRRDQPSGCPPGTQVEVRNLFFNTPARLKFLKGPTAEASRIEQLIRRYVLGHPDVSFRLVIDGDERLNYRGTGELRDAIGQLYGWAVAERLVSFDADERGVRVSGFTSPPSMSRSNRSEMHVFVNRRWIQSRSLLFAIQEAYSSLLMVGRFPLSVVQLSVPPDQLDVNVHPAKSEVRFADERGVTSLTGRTLRAAVMGSEVERAKPDIRQFGFSDTESPPDASAIIRTGSPQEASAQPATPAQELPEGRLPPLRILGQLTRTYIIAEGPGGMCLIDQHAAHERVLLEQFQAARAAHQVERQVLLEPAVVPLTPKQRDHAHDLLAELDALGFLAEPFGEGALLLRALPANTRADEAEGLLIALTDGLEGLASAEERSRAMMASMACHSAIRAGKVLDMSEMRQLIQALEQTRVPLACAHGRPTMLEISSQSLAREFGRLGAR